MKSYETIEHTADIGIRAFGKSLEQLFENMALGMFEQMADLSQVIEKQEKKIFVEAANEEELLIEWLNELLYLFFVKKYIFNTFKVKKILYHQKLEAEVCGLKLVKMNHPGIIKKEIKAATYHQLKIQQENGIYIAEVIFDV
ncbi:MAG: archease [bacterium]|nr:archease [bacterium]